MFNYSTVYNRWKLTVMATDVHQWLSIYVTETECKKKYQWYTKDCV